MHNKYFIRIRLMNKINTLHHNIKVISYIYILFYLNIISKVYKANLDNKHYKHININVPIIKI